MNTGTYLGVGANTVLLPRSVERNDRIFVHAIDVRLACVLTSDEGGETKGGRKQAIRSTRKSPGGEKKCGGHVLRAVRAVRAVRPVRPVPKTVLS